MLVSPLIQSLFAGRFPEISGLLVEGWIEEGQDWFKVAEDARRRVDLVGHEGSPAYASSPAQKSCLRLFMAQLERLAVMLPEIQLTIQEKLLISCRHSIRQEGSSHLLPVLLKKSQEDALNNLTI